MPLLEAAEAMLGKFAPDVVLALLSAVARRCFQQVVSSHGARAPRQ